MSNVSSTITISVRFLADNTDHEVSTDLGVTVRQFKELLREQLPSLRELSSIPTEVLKLSLEGFDGGELTGNVMEDDRLLSTYPLTEERRPVLLALERPVEKIGCPICQQPFAQWSSDRLCSGNATEEETDQEKLKKRKNRIPQLLNCGHAVCLECLKDQFVAVEEAMAEEKEYLLTDPKALPKEAVEEQNRLAMKKAEEKARRTRERGKAEYMWRLACPFKDCGVVSYGRRDQEWLPHEGMQKLVHLKNREWMEAEKSRGKCFCCGAESLISCPSCNNMKYCITHFNYLHRLDELRDHKPQFLLSGGGSTGDVLKTRFCCYCGGESASCGGGKLHCDHQDDDLTSVRKVAKSVATEQLAILGNLQTDCVKELVRWNDVMDRLQEGRLSSIEKLRKVFDDLIAGLEARKKDMLSELRRQCRMRELEVHEKMAAWGKLSGELEAGMRHFRQALEESTKAGGIHCDGELCAIRNVVDIHVLREAVVQLNSQSSSEPLLPFAETSVESAHITQGMHAVGEINLFDNKDVLVPGSIFPQFVGYEDKTVSSKQSKQNGEVGIAFAFNYQKKNKARVDNTQATQANSEFSFGAPPPSASTQLNVFEVDFETLAPTSYDFASSFGFEEFDVAAHTTQNSGFDDFAGTSSASSAVLTGFEDFGTSKPSVHSLRTDNFRALSTSSSEDGFDDFAALPSTNRASLSDFGDVPAEHYGKTNSQTGSNWFSGFEETKETTTRFDEFDFGNTTF